MISFLNDYNELCHPRILEDLAKYQAEKNLGYSNDRHSFRAMDLLKDLMKDDSLDIHFVHGGTIVNILAVLFMLKAYEGIIACDSGHIVGVENGSIEALGHKIVTVPNENGKLTVDLIDEAIKNNSKEYSVSLRAVYISNATEMGTVYTKEELEDISSYCKENGLYFFMDGARIGTAIAAKKSDLSYEDLPKLFDVFSIGGTKNGMLMGEALVIANPDLKKGARKLIKQRGALLAKGFLMAIQFETMFEDGLYMQLAEKAVAKAKKLAQVFVDNGIKLEFDQESNLVFPILSKDLIAKLNKDFYFETSGEVSGTERSTRFVASYMTSNQDIEALDRKIKEYK